MRQQHTKTLRELPIGWALVYEEEGIRPGELSAMRDLMIDE